MRWSREEGGYRSGPWSITKNVDDDEQNLFGVQVHWLLRRDGRPIEMHNRLSDAKRDAERMETGK